MDSRRDSLISLAMAVALHALLVAFLFIGFRFASPQRPVYVPGPIIEATLVDFQPAAQQVDDRAEQAAAAAAAERQRQEQARREQQQRETVQRQQLEQQRETERRAELQRLAEQRAAQQTEAEQQRLEELRRRETEQQRQLEEIRAQREQAERQTRLEAERLAQIEDQRRREEAETQRREAAERAAAVERAAADARTAAADAERAQRAGQEGELASLRAQYQAAIKALVESRWLRPPTARSGLQCLVRVIQIPGGEVIAVNVIPNRCNADEPTQRSVEQAVMRAQPLPYRGFESVFDREIRFTFAPED